ncbi:MAG TPA: LuxR family transcriptional regulator [Ignavibacteria bacterium]|nr:LuxR family transcriptional regulator [Ignavibacteria bacterium]
MNASETGRKIDEIIDYADKHQNNAPAGVIKKLRIAEKLASKTDYRRYDIYKKIGLIYSNRGCHDKAFEYFFKAEKTPAAIKDEEKHSEILSLIGNTYYKIYNTKSALEYLLSALKIQQSIGDRRGECLTLIRIGNVYYLNKDDIKKASACFSKANKISKLAKSKRFEALTTGALADCYYESGNYKKSIAFYKHCLKLIEEQKDDYYKVGAYEGLTKSYFALKKYQQSLEYAMKSLDAGRNFANYNIMFIALGNIILIYYKLKDSKHVLHYINEAKKIEKKIDDRLALRDFYKELSKIYSAENPAMALDYFMKYHYVYSEINGEELQRKTNELKAVFERIQAEKEAEILRLKTLELKREVDSKTKEMNLMANYLVQKNDLIKKLTEDIKKYSRNFKTSKVDFREFDEFLKTIEINNRLTDDVIIFEKNLDTLNFAFINKLSKKYSALTPIQLKICSLLKINLSNKEISNLLHISNRTVQNQRYKIIQKLKLPRKQSLTTFINTF